MKPATVGSDPVVVDLHAGGKVVEIPQAPTVEKVVVAPQGQMVETGLPQAQGYYIDDACTVEKVVQAPRVPSAPQQRTCQH